MLVREEIDMPRKVLVVDDSIFMRRLVGDIIKQDKDLEVVGFAKNGLEAIQLNEELNPDVILLDVEMPLLDGIGALERIMNEKKCPVVMFSSLTLEGAKTTVEALDLGA